MHTSIDSDFVALHSQHTLQHADWLAVFAIAKNEGVGEHLDSYDFEDFLGLAVYLLVTTQSQYNREQLSQLLPKFGSAVVLPLLKILYKQDVFAEQAIPILAQQSLDTMAPYSLIVGIDQVLGMNIQDDLAVVALRVAKQLLQSCEPSTCLILSRLLSETNRQLVSEFSMPRSEYMSTVRRGQYDDALLGHGAVHCV